MSEKKENEIVIDLSKKIKFSDNIYVSIGSLILSSLVLLIQVLWALWSNNWVWTDQCWLTLFNYVYAVRWGKLDKKEKEENISENND